MAEGGGLLNVDYASRPSSMFPRKSYRFNNFLHRAAWLLLAVEALFWAVAGTILGTAPGEILLTVPPCKHRFERREVARKTRPETCPRSLAISAASSEMTPKS